MEELVDGNQHVHIGHPCDYLLLERCHMIMTFSISYWYSFSKSSIVFVAFTKFSFLFYISNSAVKPSHCTKYLSFSWTCCLFNILLTFHSPSSSITTRVGCSLLYPSTCPIYLYILLTLTTRCIFIVLSNSNLTMFININLIRAYKFLC